MTKMNHLKLKKEFSKFEYHIKVTEFAWLSSQNTLSWQAYRVQKKYEVPQQEKKMKLGMIL